jgi:hypothetical protein
MHWNKVHAELQCLQPLPWWIRELSTEPENSHTWLQYQAMISHISNQNHGDSFHMPSDSSFGQTSGYFQIAMRTHQMLFTYCKYFRFCVFTLNVTEKPNIVTVDYTEQHSRSQSSSHSPPWEPEPSPWFKWLLLSFGMELTKLCWNSFQNNIMGSMNYVGRANCILCLYYDSWNICTVPVSPPPQRSLSHNSLSGKTNTLG